MSYYNFGVFTIFVLAVCVPPDNQVQWCLIFETFDG
jgi:hypothetical protein